MNKKILERINKLESYILEDDTPKMVKTAFKKELKYLREELKEKAVNED